MAEFPPVRILYDGADTVGLSEFQEFEFIAVSSGGTGASSVTDVAASLNIVSSLSGLGDTDIITPTAGQVLTWDGADDDWTPSTSPAGVTALSALSDATIVDSPTDAVSLVWSAVPEVWVASALDHTQNIANVGTNTHAQIDTHIANGGVHFTIPGISHTAIDDIGTNTHPQIDTHLADVEVHFPIASANVSSLNDVDASTSPVVGAALLWSAGTEQWVASTIDHLTNIDNVGTNTHAQIDTHIADGATHFTEGSIDHTNIANVGTNTHAQIDTHIGDSTVHFTEGSIDHTNIANIGTNTHPQIDTHIADVEVHFSIASANVSSLNDVDASTSPVVGAALLWSATVEQWVASTIDHVTNIDNVGTNTHAQIDTHIADGATHFTEGSIDHTNLLNIGTDSHATIDAHIDDGTLHFLEGAIDHTNLLNIGTDSHATIDTHIGDSTVHFTEANIKKIFRPFWHIESPTATDKIGLFKTPVPITILAFSAVVAGSTPSITFNIQFSEDYSDGTPDELWSTDEVITNTTLGDAGAAFNDATIPASFWVWVKMSAQSGTTDMVNIYLEYQED